jgi:hypothetical protein
MMSSVEFEGKTLDDVLQEVRAGKRKAVIIPGNLEADGIRADVVFEDWPWHYPIGQLEQPPDFPEAPPWYLSRNAEEAERQAIEFTERLGISPEERLLIIVSSMRAQDLLRSVKVKRNPETDEATLYTGDGTELITLDAKDAARLYQQLAEGYGWAYSALCPECQVELENGECPNCGWEGYA